MTISLKRILFVVTSIAIAFAVLKAEGNAPECQLAFFKSPVEYFPTPLEIVNEEGLIAQRAPLNVYSLNEGYRKGAFPWVETNNEVEWYAPPTRAILILNHFRLNKTNRKILKKHNYIITFNKSFERVIRTASKVHTKAKGTESWITENFIRAYVDFHKMGFAESVEVWRDRKLVGGLYGVKLNGIYYGESMFHTESNASKIALFALVEQLKSEGVQWMETQQLSELMRSVGGKEISREQFELMIYP